jgi:hypothetical protein
MNVLAEQGLEEERPPWVPGEIQEEVDRRFANEQQNKSR